MHIATRSSVLLLALTACEAEPDFALPPVTANTGRVEYRSESPLDHCPAAPARVQARLDGLESILGVRGPERIRYSKFDVEAHVKANCNDAVGCAFGADALSMEYVDPHELVHIVMPWRRPPDLFKEGIAVALGYGSLKPVAPWPAWADVMSGKSRPTYAYGGAFTTYLAATYGIGAVVRLFDSRWDEDDSAAGLARKFAQSFPVSIDDAWQAAAAVTGASSLCAELASTITVDGSEAVPSGEECTGGLIEARHAFVLDDDTPLAIETTYSSTWIGGCGTNIDAPFVADSPIVKRPDQSIAVHLAAWQKGKYHVNAEVTRPDESFRARTGAWMGRSCALLAPYPLGGTPSTLAQLVVVARGGDDVWIAIAWAGDAPVAFPQVVTGNAGYHWSACGRCGDEPSCTSLDGGLTLAPGVSWLHAVRPSDNTASTDVMAAYREYR